MAPPGSSGRHKSSHKDFTGVLSFYRTHNFQLVHLYSREMGESMLCVAEFFIIYTGNVCKSSPNEALGNQVSSKTSKLVTVLVQDTGHHEAADV